MAAPPPPRRRQPRLAAGRARALGLPTRGTTNPNRLRRMDNWIVARLAGRLRAADDPLVVDLGYGATPVTAVELAARLASVRADVRVLGLEIDAERVAAARSAAEPPRLTFERGGFELAGHRPVIVRAANVLRQYDENAALDAWATMTECLADGGVLVEGTCDELGRLGSWVLLERSGPVSVTFAARLDALEQPARFAERLPKALIHHNVPGEPVHDFLAALGGEWERAAALGTFGVRQRWGAAVRALVDSGWPVEADRARHGELTVAWAAVAPRRASGWSAGQSLPHAAESERGRLR